MGKSHLSEEDIKLRYITPAIQNAGWDNKQIRMEYAFTAGRIILRGNITARGRKKSADYLLSYKNNFPLAIVEAKDNNQPVGAGLQQAIDYAKSLDVPYVYASNGDGFVEQNLITGEVKELKLEEFPSPEALYQRYRIDKGIDEAEEKVMLEPYYYIPNYKTPRYYQRVAINRTVDAVAKGRNRVLVVSATGERVIIVTGCINALRSRVSGTLVNMIHALLRVIKYNYCKQCMRSKDVLALQY